MKKETKGIEKFDLKNLVPLDRSKMKNVLGGDDVYDPGNDMPGTELSVTIHTGGGDNTVDH